MIACPVRLILAGILAVVISSQTALAEFIDNHDGTVSDTSYGLRWQLAGDGVLRDFQAANGYCRDLSLAGYSGWRLPGMNEFLRLLDYDKINIISYQSPTVAPFQLINGIYWSGSFIQGIFTAGAVYQEAWIINSGNGGVSLEPLFFGQSNNSYYVHCVREQNECQATYFSDGTLSIPCVKAGSSGNYTVDMKLHSTEPGILFEVLQIQRK